MQQAALGVATICGSLEIQGAHTLGTSVGMGVGEGVGEGVGDGVGDGVGEGVGEGVGVGVTGTCRKQHVASDQHRAICFSISHISWPGPFVAAKQSMHSAACVSRLLIRCIHVAVKCTRPYTVVGLSSLGMPSSC